MDFLFELWTRLSARTEALSVGTVWLTVAAAALLVLIPVAWRMTRHVVTIAHEGGHGLVASMSGRKLSGIRLHSDTSGLTVSRGRPTGPGMIATLLAGYPAPALLGLGAARLLSLGYAVGLLWILLVALALLLVQIRNWFGLWSVLVTAAVVFSVTQFGSSVVQGVFALLVTTFLLLGSVRTIVELQVTRSRRRTFSSDADQLARLTHLPGLFWVGVFLSVSLASVALSAHFLGLACVVGCT